MVTLNLIRIKCDRTYPEAVEFIQLMTPIRDHLHLEVAGHYTTIQKAFDRMSMHIGRLVLDETLDDIDLSGLTGIDATGFGRSVEFIYYGRTAKVDFRTVKTTVLVNLDKQVILDAHLTTTRKHDTNFGPKLLKKHPELSVLAGNKGYGDQRFRRHLREHDGGPGRSPSACFRTTWRRVGMSWNFLA